MLNDIAAWAGILAIPLGVLAIWLPLRATYGARQRELRQKLREQLEEIRKVCEGYDYSRTMNESDLERFLYAADENIRALAERDGIVAPNHLLLSMYREILGDAAGRCNLDLPGPTFIPNRDELLANNSGMLKFRLLQAQAMSVILLKTVNSIDNGNYWTYLRAKRYKGDITHFTLPSFRRQRSEE